MLRNYISAAIGNLSRNWLYSGITILGLGVSFAAAILIGLYLRDEYSFDRFIPDYQRVYRLESTLTIPGEKPVPGDYVQASAAANLALDFPGVERAARMQVGGVSLRRGDIEALEQVGWVDPGFFSIVRLPVAAGDLKAALEAPDGLVLSRAMARKYFGEDAPIGKTLRVSMVETIPGLPPDEARRLATPQVMRVLAVLGELPSSSHIDLGLFGSSRAALSTIALEDRHPSPFEIDSLTYVKLKPGASVGAIKAGLTAFANRHYPSMNGGASFEKLSLTPLARLHFDAHQAGDGFRPPGDRAVDAGIGAVGLLIILIAAINFVTLMTARATRRAVEVGVRKAVGAGRSDLVLQFMGEAVVYVLAGLVIGVSLAELLLPYANAFVGRTIRFDYLADPWLVAALLGVALLTSLGAGLYPALIISAFRPAQALKGGLGPAGGSGGVRQVLVVVQFAILIGLIVMTATIYRQTNFALDRALRLDADQVLRIETPCEAGLRQQIAALPGVKAVACASGNVVSGSYSTTMMSTPGRTAVSVDLGPLDVGFLELQGLKPLAGRFFDPSRGQDVLLRNSGEAATGLPTVVLNETAARRLGFGDVRDAVGKTIRWGRWAIAPTGGPTMIGGSSQVIGVVRDFSLGASVRDRINPMLYYVDPAVGNFMAIKLSGREIPETLRGIDRAWRSTGHDRALPQRFESQVVQDLYKDVITQGIAIAICAGLAILIACLGLFALAAFTTERRIKEIGVRKAMGASSFDIVRLLLWQFTKPVLWANLIAWPIAFWAMDHWLHGFAYRVDLPAWLFVLAAAAAVLIAWATVSAHAWLAARSRPATALRYE
jgi:putative ABC transport system permease protein